MKFSYGFRLFVKKFEGMGCLLITKTVQSSLK